jgi:uncharacterized iron-regulated membrane protein
VNKGHVSLLSSQSVVLALCALIALCILVGLAVLYRRDRRRARASSRMAAARSDELAAWLGILHETDHTLLHIALRAQTERERLERLRLEVEVRSRRLAGERRVRQGTIADREITGGPAS